MDRDEQIARDIVDGECFSPAQNVDTKALREVIAAALRAARAEERERCAKIIEDDRDGWLMCEPGPLVNSIVNRLAVVSEKVRADPTGEPNG